MQRRRDKIKKRKRSFDKAGQEDEITRKRRRPVELS